jgi:DNA-binding transcriptional LysR family regulator
MTQLNRFDLNLLVVFDAIYTERGISRAAERLNVTQSAVSHALSRMREQLGDQLFTRRGHEMIPTAAANQLSEPIKRALVEIDASIKGLDRFDPVSSSRHFRIGVRGFTESVILPPLFRALRRQGPNLTMGAVHYGRATLSKLLHAGAIDLAIDTMTATSADVSAEMLGRSRLVVMLREGHPALAGPLDFDAFAKLDHMIASTNSRGKTLEDAALRAAGKTRRVVLRCQNFTSASHAVAESDAALTIPEYFANLLLVPGRHRVVPGPFIGESAAIHMYWNSRADTDPAITWLRTLARDNLTRTFAVKSQE